MKICWAKDFFFFFDSSLFTSLVEGTWCCKLPLNKLWYNISLSQLALSQEIAHIWLGSIRLRLGCKWTPSTIANLLQGTGFVPQPAPGSSCPRAILLSQLYGTTAPAGYITDLQPFQSVCTAGEERQRKEQSSCRKEQHLGPTGALQTEVI